MVVLWAMTAMARGRPFPNMAHPCGTLSSQGSLVSEPGVGLHALGQTRQITVHDTIRQRQFIF